MLSNSSYDIACSCTGGSLYPDSIDNTEPIFLRIYRSYISSDLDKFEFMVLYRHTLAQPALVDVFGPFL